MQEITYKEKILKSFPIHDKKVREILEFDERFNQFADKVREYYTKQLQVEQESALRCTHTLNS